MCGGVHVTRIRKQFRSDFSTFDNKKRYRIADRLFVGVGILLAVCIAILCFAGKNSPFFYIMLASTILVAGGMLYTDFLARRYIKKFCFLCGKDFSFNESIVELYDDIGHFTRAACHESCWDRLEASHPFKWCTGEVLAKDK